MSELEALLEALVAQSRAGVVTRPGLDRLDELAEAAGVDELTAAVLRVDMLRERLGEQLPRNWPAILAGVRLALELDLGRR